MTNRWSRRAPLTGIAFVVLFIASVTVSTAPSNTASDREWLAAYASHGEQARHLATGVLLVLAALALMTFLTHLWTRIVAASDRRLSPLPVVAAGVASACIACGGVLMAGISGSSLLYSQPIPGADVLRLGNDLGFAMVGIAGMFAASVSIASVSAQARSAGVFGVRMLRLSWAVAVVLLGSIAFVPILALLVWLVAVAVVLIQSDIPGEQANPRTSSATVGAALE
jgi:hypothetical protein